MADKKISQLANQAPVLSDISVFVDADTTLQYSFTQLLALLAANLSTGAVFTFGTSIPSNSVGNNGDIYVKTTTGQFAQKLSGIWTVVYTIVQGVIGSSIYYGSGAPTTQGINGDTYLRTSNGTFYTKIAGTWTLEFSMATGPTGPTGPAGGNGTNGTNGLTILNGASNPSNLYDGVNGDFFINTSTWNIFGPKTAGAWGTGIALSFSGGAPVIISIPSGSAYPLNISMGTGPQAIYNQTPWCETQIYLLDNIYNPVSGTGAVKPIQKFDVQVDKNFTDKTLTTIASLDVWGYPNSPVSGSPVTLFPLLLILKP